MTHRPKMEPAMNRADALASIDMNIATIRVLRRRMAAAGTSKVVAACDKVLSCPWGQSPDAAVLAVIAAHIEGVKAEERSIPRDNAAPRFPVFWA